ncbi:flavin reductase (DIM6/NTAB) family NADH-FMN oxidoreductase RutF [Ensifer sp. 4252]
MDFDFTRLPAQDRYRLPTNFIGPRPSALVSTRSPNGQDNAAPMSFFNVFSHDPPLARLHANNDITSDRQFEMQARDIASFAALKMKTN